jgi:hypothetical protein
MANIRDDHCTSNDHHPLLLEEQGTAIRSRPLPGLVGNLKKNLLKRPATLNYVNYASTLQFATLSRESSFCHNHRGKVMATSCTSCPAISGLAVERSQQLLTLLALTYACHSSLLKRPALEGDMGST